MVFSDYNKQQEELLRTLNGFLGGKGCLTYGSRGCQYIESDILYNCPAFVLEVSDTIGAGDAYFSLFGLMESVNVPMEVGVFMGNIEGGLASNVIRNKESVKRENVLKYMCTLLNF